MQKPIVGKFSRLLEIGHFRTSAALCMQGCVLYRKPKYLIWTSVLFFPYNENTFTTPNLLAHIHERSAG